jgi:2-C-methyl-D-erythritol 4-phosphate cytidylyltransferase
VTATSRPSPVRAALVVLAGGSGTRLGAGTNKVYLPLAGHPVLSWSFRWAAEVPEITRLLLVTRLDDVALADDLLRRDLAGLAVEVVPGGASRHGSEQAALDHLEPLVDAGELDVIAIHDGARPLTGPALMAAVVRAAAGTGGAVPGLPVSDLLPLDAAGRPSADDRPSADGSVGRLVGMQTPQAFRARPLLAAYRAASAAGFEGTDTAASMETFGDLPIRVVPGGRWNLKVTFPHDLEVAERLLAANGYRMP